MRVLLVVTLSIATILVALLLPPMDLPPSYHNFADQRSWLGIPNLLNVISNAPFAVVGLLGLLFLGRHGAPRPGGPLTEAWERPALAVLFSGIALTAFGSAYYHLAPSNATLVWDRLPMSIVFTSLLAITIGERISGKAGAWLLTPFAALGAASVLYWRATVLRGAGDLRPYGVVQVIPALSILLLVLLFPPKYTRTADLFRMLGWYASARVFELLDAALFRAGHIVSGHTLKHLAAGMATYCLLRMFERRRLPSAGDERDSRQKAEPVDQDQAHRPAERRF